MDIHIRQLENAVQAGNINLYPDLLRAYLRSGYVMRVALELAAAYGVPASIDVVGKDSHQHNEIVNDFYYRQLGRVSWVREFFLRRGCALADYFYNEVWKSYPFDIKCRNLPYTGSRGPTADAYPGEMLTTIKKFVSQFYTLNPSVDTLGSAYLNFREHQTRIIALFEGLEHDDPAAPAWHYLFRILHALCVSIIGEINWIRDNRNLYDPRRVAPGPNSPVTTTVLETGWFPLFNVLDHSEQQNRLRGVNALRAHLNQISPTPRTDGQIRSLLELEIGIRLDSWLLKPYTNYHGLQNVPPE